MWLGDVGGYLLGVMSSEKEEEGTSASAPGLKRPGGDSTATEEATGGGVVAPSAAGAEGDAGRGADGEEHVFQQSFPIPEYKIGWIIGKRGSYVKQLQQKSGATIVVSTTTSKEYGQVWKYLQIIGTGRAIDRAKKLLHIRLERLELENMDDEAYIGEEG